MQPLLNIAVSAARAGARPILTAYRRGEVGAIRAKARNDHVTEIDHAAEEAIVATIRRAYPDHAILAEESGASGGRRDEVEWIVDPIDGTTNFIRGLPHFAISIACRVRGELAHGVIYDPVKDELFTASRGDGAQKDGRRIRVSGALRLDQALVATGFAYRKSGEIGDHLAAFTRVLETAGDIRRAGSAALDLAYVAAGRLDGYWERGLAPWDIAAGLLLVREAGGIATDPDAPDDNDPLETGAVIAGTPKIYAALKKEITTEAQRTQSKKT
jgi:myo-inositol-1(or 4)-monophosphatase